MPVSVLILCLATAAEPPLIPPPAVATLSASDHDSADFILAGLREGRQRLRTGVYRAEGRYTEPGSQANGTNDLDAEIHVFSAFDHDDGLLRFERDHPLRVMAPQGVDMRDPNPPGPPGSRMERARTAPKVLGQKMVRVKYIRTPEKWHEWVDRDYEGESRLVTVKSPGASLLEPDLDAWDIRTTGLIGAENFIRPVSYFEFESLLSHLLIGKNLESITKEPDGLSRLDYRSAEQPGFLNHLYVDTRRGFTPVRQELSLWNYQSGRWSEPQDVVEVTWDEVAGVWVPSAAVFKVLTNPEQPKTLSLDFEWLSVNDVPEKLFSPESLEVDPHSLIVDLRLDRRIITGKVGDPNYRPTTRPGAPENKVSSFWYLAVTGIAVLILAGWLAYRRSREAA